MSLASYLHHIAMRLGGTLRAESERRRIEERIRAEGFAYEAEVRERRLKLHQAEEEKTPRTAPRGA